MNAQAQRESRMLIFLRYVEEHSVSGDEVMNEDQAHSHCGWIFGMEVSCGMCPDSHPLTITFSSN